ncbi:MAG: hypothetical protein BWY66_01690 [bacterium ADurb.Bin374]|nr:MAG: hypothetical protein BWY66_01690 [bacterium ADurb.Bin374]
MGLLLIPVEVDELLLELAVTRHLGVAQAPVGVGHAVLELVKLLPDLVDAPGAGQHLLDHGPASHFADGLGKIAHNDAGQHRHLALVGLLFAGDQAEYRGLAGAVRADQADLVPRPNQETSVLEQDALAIRDLDIRKIDHACLVLYIMNCI